MVKLISFEFEREKIRNISTPGLPAKETGMVLSPTAIERRLSSPLNPWARATLNPKLMRKPQGPKLKTYIRPSPAVTVDYPQPEVM